MKGKFLPTIILLLISSLILAACGGSDSQANSSTTSGIPAVVDGVSVDVKKNHYYAAVNGNYPDSCTRISDVQQEIDGDKIKFILTTDKPADLMCAQMITPFAVDLLIETGGLLPGEYTIDVNGIATTFTLGE
jgi:hypothetical protein